MALSCWLIALVLFSLDPAGSWGQNDRMALRYGVLAAPATTTTVLQPSVTASAAATHAAEFTPIVPKAQVPLVAVLPPGHTCLTMCINHAIQTSTVTKTSVITTISPSVSTTISTSVSTTVSTLTFCPTPVPAFPTTTTATTVTALPVTNSTTIATPTQQIESSFTLLDIGPPPPAPSSSVFKSMSAPCEEGGAAAATQ